MIVENQDGTQLELPDGSQPADIEGAFAHYQSTLPAPSFSQNVGNDFDKRVDEGQQMIIDNLQGKSGAVPTAFGLAGVAGGIINNMATEGAKSASSILPDAYTNLLKSGGKAIGDFLTSGAKGISDVSGIGNVLHNNPDIAKTLGGAANVAGASAILGGAAAVGGVAKDAAGAAMAPLVRPAALTPDVANIVKGAESSGVTVPNAALLDADSFAAKHTNIKGFADYKDAVNKNAADLIGANDAGGAHSTINEPALLDAKKNNGAAIQAVDTSIGNVPIAPRAAQINSEIAAGLPSDDSFWRRFVGDVQAKQNPDGTIHAADIRDLTGYNSDIAKKARGTTNDAPIAKRVIAQFKGAINDVATPEQQAALSDVNNKYKLMSEFSDTAKTTGAGAKLDPVKIRDILNKAYSDPNETQYPARVLQNTLNTFHPVAGTESPLRGLSNAATSLKSEGGLTPAQEIGMGFAAGHAPAATLWATIQKSAPWVFNKAYSPFTNSDFYRNALLRNATSPITKETLVPTAKASAAPLQLPFTPKASLASPEKDFVPTNEAYTTPSPGGISERPYSGQQRIQTNEERDAAIAGRQSPDIKAAQTARAEQTPSSVLNTELRQRQAVFENINGWDKASQVLSAKGRTYKEIVDQIGERPKPPDNNSFLKMLNSFGGQAAKKTQ